MESYHVTVNCMTTSYVLNIILYDYHVTVDFMTTSYLLNIKLSDKFNTKVFIQD